MRTRKSSSLLAAALAAGLIGWSAIPATAQQADQQQGQPNQQPQQPGQQADQQGGQQSENQSVPQQGRDVDLDSPPRNVQQQPQGTIDSLVRGDRIDQTLSEAEMNNIRGTLASATEAAVKGSLRDLTERMIDADQERLNQDIQRGDEQFAQQIAPFRQAWQQKYNDEFDVEDRQQVFGQQVSITKGVPAPREQLAQQGQLTQPQGQQQQQAAGQSDRVTPAEAAQPGQQVQATGPGEVTQLPGAAGLKEQVLTNRAQDQQNQQSASAQQGGAQDAQAQQGGAQQGGSQDAQAQQAASKTNADAFAGKGATVTLPASHGMPELKIPVINQGYGVDAWRIDVPVSVDAQKLKSNLQQALQQLQQQQAQWPPDKNQANLMVVHAVMAALMDQGPGGGAGGAQQDLQQQQPLGQQPGQQQQQPAQPGGQSQ